MEFTPQIGLLLVGCAIASWTDARTGKILNTLTGPMILGGLLVNSALGDWTVGVYGFVAAAVLHYPMWMLGVEKGGDVKLLMGIGACVGAWELIETTFWYAALYIPVGIGVLIYRRRLANLVKVSAHIAKKATGTADEGDVAPSATILWTAPVISLAAVGAWLTDIPALQ
ncbi:MAG: Flp pilus assembly protein protease CpaA [Myxococcota bacterium]|jgi:Flp pilus assembly protein protease CpaA